MNEEQLVRIVYLYGRSREKLNHIRDDLSAYQGYVALSKSLWHMLKANDAVHEDGNVKEQYLHALEAGRDSVLEFKVTNLSSLSQLITRQAGEENPSNYE